MVIKLRIFKNRIKEIARVCCSGDLLSGGDIWAVTRMRGKAVQAQRAEGSSRQKEQQVQSPEAGMSSEHSRETEGGLRSWKDAALGKSCRQWGEKGQIIENLLSQVKKLRFYSNSSKKSLEGFKQREGCDLIYVFKTIALAFRWKADQGRKEEGKQGEPARDWGSGPGERRSLNFFFCVSFQGPTHGICWFPG